MRQKRRTELHRRIFRYTGAAAAILVAVFMLLQRDDAQKTLHAAEPTIQEDFLMFYADASEKLDAIEYEVASAISM